jgi:hypothetical protein
MASGRTIIVVAALTALLLAGCATPAVDAEPTPPPASATPVPTAAAAGPTVRVPLGCEDLADSAELEALAGSALSPVDPFVDGAASLVRSADLQYGALDCAWSTGPLDYDQAMPSVVVTVVPDVTADRWAEFLPMVNHPDSITGGYGPDSFVSCTPDGAPSGCSLHNFLHGYWLSVAVSSPTPDVNQVSVAPLFARATAAVLGAAAAGPHWVSASGASVRTGELDTAAARTALGADSLEYAVDGITPQIGARWLPAVETGMTRGAYIANGLPSGASLNFYLEVLPSGAWALDSGLLSPLARNIDGLGDEAISYSSAGSSTVVFRLGDDLVLVSATVAVVDGPADLEDTVAIATAVAGAIG